MSLMLGEGFRLPDVLPADPVPDVNDLRIELVLEALESLRSSLNMLPAPQVTIDAPDLSAIVNAVNGLRPGVVDPDEIGRAVANALIPMRPDAASTDWQDRLVTALEKLDYRMKGIGANSGAHGVINLPNEPARQLGIVSITGPVTTSAPVPSGAFNYAAGVSGAPTVPAGARVQTITAHCTVAGSLTINGGATVPIPANSSFSATYTDTKLIAPSVLFTGTDSYYLDWLL